MLGLCLTVCPSSMSMYLRHYFYIISWHNQEMNTSIISFKALVCIFCLCKVMKSHALIQCALSRAIHHKCMQMTKLCQHAGSVNVITGIIRSEYNSSNYFCFLFLFLFLSLSISFLLLLFFLIFGAFFFTSLCSWMSAFLMHWLNIGRLVEIKLCRSEKNRLLFSDK